VHVAAAVGEAKALGAGGALEGQEVQRITSAELAVCAAEVLHLPAREANCDASSRELTQLVALSLRGCSALCTSSGDVPIDSRSEAHDSNGDHG